jgi:hypothetical protein
VEQPIPCVVKTVLSPISRCITSTYCSLSLSWNCEFGLFNFQLPSSYNHQSSGLEGRNGNPTPTIKISKLISTCNNLKQTQLQNVGSHPGLSGSPGSWVDRVLPSHCTGRSFNKPGPVQPPGRSVSGSTHRAGPGLITMLSTLATSIRQTTT